MDEVQKSSSLKNSIILFANLHSGCLLTLNPLKVEYSYNQILMEYMENANLKIVLLTAQVGIC
jgi:hypothetical protein